MLAISDLHLASPVNRDALAALPDFPDDWLIVAGDIAEQPSRVAAAFTALTRRFAKVIWTPGNHDLWTVPGMAWRGPRKYEALVDLAREHGVVTPEDPFPVWPGPGGEVVIAPLFLLYDYTFRPPHLPLARVVEWAREERAMCGDEFMLAPTPYASRIAWCHARCATAADRLAGLEGAPTIIVNHYPLRHDLVRIPRAPRFSPWCGTVLTEDWHRRFNVKVAVSGHIHLRRTDWRDGTRFEEVSLGYPRQWRQERGLQAYLRQIWPTPEPPPAAGFGPR
nr:metallophosphoesterase [Acuticoccus mangrovi]